MNWPIGANVLVQLIGLLDQSTGVPVTTATVTSRLQSYSGAPTTYPNGGVDVAGVSWPITLAHVAGGNYAFTCGNGSVLVAGMTYQLYTVATDGSVTQTFTDAVIAVQPI